MAYRQYLYPKTAAPTVNDDTLDGYLVGDVWLDTTNDRIYQSIDVTAAAAIWLEMQQPTRPMNQYTLSVTVASNDLIVALKTLAGTDPSATDKIYLNIGGTIRTVSAATSITLADGTSWFNMGSDELKTKEVDLFLYAIWDSNSSVVAIAPARYPGGRLVSDFSATTTNEKYLGNYANYTSTDSVAVIGRFAATLSAGAGYTWTVPTFTSINLRHEPTAETRKLTYTTVLTGFSGTPTQTCVYAIRGNTITFSQTISGTSNATGFTSTIPFTATSGTNDVQRLIDNGGAVTGLITLAGSTITYYASVAAGGFTGSGTKGVEAITKTVFIS